MTASHGLISATTASVRDEGSQMIVATGLTNCGADSPRIAAADRSGLRDAG